ncbi:MAG: hypothetical protein NTY99_03145 [DPANN group archaeon]|nr:hypothetical protein [DPANN group archaeon]
MGTGISNKGSERSFGIYVALLIVIVLLIALCLVEKNDLVTGSFVLP